MYQGVKGQIIFGLEVSVKVTWQSNVRLRRDASYD